MGFTRTKIHIEVVGAEAATRSLKGVAVAEEQIHTTGTQAAKGLTQVEVATTRAGAASAIASEKARKLHAEINAVAMPANGARVAMEGLGKGLTFLQKAAAILPGFGIAGLLLEIGRAASWLSEQFVAGEKSTALQTAALAEYTRIVNEAAKAVRELGRAQSEAGRSRIGGALGIDPRALSGNARVQGAQLEAERGTLDARQRALDTQAGELAAAERSVRERAAALSGSAANGVRLGMFGTAASLEAEARAIGERRRVLVAEAEKLRGAEVDLESKVEGLRRAAGVADSQKAGGGRASPTKAPPAPGISGFEVMLPGMGTVRPVEAAQNALRNGPGLAEVAAFQEQSRQMQAQQLADEQLAMEHRNAMMAEHMQAVSAATTQQRDLFATLSDTASSSLGGMVDSAMNSATMLVNIVGTITGAFGSMATNMILSGDAGSKAIKKSVANALAGYSAQAFGLAALLSIAGAAAAATGPIFGWYAPQIFTAAGIAAAGGVALGLSARALGADKIGASPSGSRSGGGGGSGGGMASAAGTNPYRSESSAPQPIHIHIGSETVTRVVDGERRREARRDGISAWSPA